jgi:hypothetical protein
VTESIKRMDIREFREHGYLMEVNRRFFHPLGLALEVGVPNPGDEDQTWRLGGIWDYRGDPEGVTFSTADGRTGLTPEDAHRAAAIDAEIEAKAACRMALFGSDSTIEPFPEAP